MGMVALIVVGDDLSNAQDILDARIRGAGNGSIRNSVYEA
jgi:hypothetical protein